MTDNLAGKMLIATPSLLDPNFKETVVLLFMHSDSGALGLVINRPLQLTHADLFQAMHIEVDGQFEEPALYGGPVSPEVGWVIHSDGFEGPETIKVGDGIFVSASPEIMEQIAQRDGPDNYLICLGYAGWAPEQLESEIVQHAWLTGIPPAELLFGVPFDRRWHGAYKALGLEPSQLTPLPIGGTA